MDLPATGAQSDKRGHRVFDEPAVARGVESAGQAANQTDRLDGRSQQQAARADCVSIIEPLAVARWRCGHIARKTCLVPKLNPTAATVAPSTIAGFSSKQPAADFWQRRFGANCGKLELAKMNPRFRGNAAMRHFHANLADAQSRALFHLSADKKLAKRKGRT